MRYIFDLLLILTILVWVLGLTAQGALPPQAVAIFLVALVFFVAAIKAGGMISRLIRFTLRVALPIGTLLTFVIVYSEGNLPRASTLFGGVLVLLVMLMGFYVMFRGLFK